LNKNLGVLGRSIFNGDVSLNQRVFVGGDVSLNGNVYVNSNSNLNGDVFMNGNTFINNNVYANTLSNSDNSNKVATTAFVTNKLGSITGSTANFSNDVNITNRLLIGSDVSMNKRLYVAGDVSMNSRLLVGSDVSLNKNLGVLGSAVFNGDVSLNQRLLVSRDVSMNSRLSVLSDVSLNGNLGVLGSAIFTGDVSLNNRLFVNRDVSLNSRLSVLSDVSLNGNLGVLGRSIFSNDVSINTKLFVSGDASLNTRLYVGGDVIIYGRLNVNNYTNNTIINTTTSNFTMIIAEDISLNGRLIVRDDVSLNNRLFVNGDISFNGKMFVSGDVSLNGNVSVPTQLTSDNSSKVASTAFVTNKVASITGSTAGFINDVNITNRLFVGSDVSFNGKMFVSGDVSMNGSISVPTQLTSDNSSKVASTAFVTNKVSSLTGATASFTNDVAIGNRLLVTNDVSFNGKMTVNGDVSMNQDLFVSLDVSFNRKLFVAGDVSMNGNVSVPTQLTSDNSTRVATTAYVTNKIAGFSTTNFSSDVSMNQRLNVLSDVSLNKRLFVGGDASLNGNIYVTGNLIANYAAGSIPSAAIFGISNFTTDVSMNQRLFVLNDVSFGGRLNVSNGLVVNIGTNTIAGSTVSPNAITNTSSSGNTWNTNGVTWIATVSTFFTAGIPASDDLVFNNTTYSSFLNVGTIGSNSGSYNTTSPFAYNSTTIGTVVSGSTIYGEWVQIQSNSALILNSYSFYTRNNFLNNNKNFIGCLPGKYTIAGSNDGSTWFRIQDGNVTALPVASAATNNSQNTSTYTITTSGTATQASNNSLTGYSTASNAYTYFRIIVTNLIGNGTYGATSDGALSDSILQFGWTPTFNTTTSTPYAWVGIGKTNPTCPLDVSGATIISGSTLFVSDVSINGRLSFNNISNEIIPPSALNPTTLTTINLNTANTSFSAFFNRPNTGLRFEDMKISSDGKYIITCSNTYVNNSYLYSPLPPPAIGYYVHISSNYGNSFYTLNDNPNTGINNLAITSDGKYMVYGIGINNVGSVNSTTSVPNLYISSNYGNSFFGKLILRGDGNRAQIISISITNAGDRIMVAGDGNLFMSTNFGNNFYIAQASDTIIGGTAMQFYTARMSPTTGKYIICIDGGRYCVMSSNYGTSFYRLTGIDFYNPYMGESGGGGYQNSPITFSSDEKYIYLTRYKDWSGIIYRSYDFGVTWSYWDGRNPTMILEEGLVNSLHCTADGKNIVVGTGYTNAGITGYVYISSNYGVNYSKIITSAGYWAAAISANGEYIYAREMYSSLYKSTAQVTYTTNKYLEFNSYDLSMNKRLFVNSIGINTSTITSGFALDVNGNIRYVAATATSDYRVKQNVKPLDETFNVDNLRPVSYYNTLSNNQDVGLIAHELQEYYPSLVHGNKDDDDYQSVNYTSLISVLIHEIQQLKKRIIKLENNTIDPSNNTDPVVPIENTDPVVPVENTEPVVPTENTDPVVPVENTDPVAPVETTDPVVPVENTDPVVPVENTESVVPTENTSV